LNLEGESPLHLAAKRASPRILQVLLESHPDALLLKNSRSQTLLHSAAKGRSKAAIKYLKKKFSDLGNLPKEHWYDSDGRSPLHLAIKYGDFSIIRRLVQMNPKMIFEKDGQGKSAIDLAFERKNWKVIQFFSTQDSDRILHELFLNDPRYSTNLNKELSDSLKSGYLDCVKSLLQLGASLDDMPSSKEAALLKSARCGRLDVVQFLVENGANIETVDEFQFTPLSIAANLGHLDIVQYLVERGACLEAPNQGGFTAVDQAVVQGKIEVAQYLISQRAKLDRAEDVAKRSSHRNRQEILKLVQEAKAIRESERQIQI
jgi:ankyrin repeat protein